MSNNRDFARKRARDRYSEPTEEVIAMMTNTTTMTDEQFGAYREVMKTFYSSWFIFKEVRPVTAHLLEELFGDRAKEYMPEINKHFTEQMAIDMVKYVNNSPAKAVKDPKLQRISLLARSYTEEE